MKEICWWCSRKLQLPNFSEVPDLDGNPLRVHKCCKQATYNHFHPKNMGKNPEPWEGYYS